MSKDYLTEAERNYKLAESILTDEHFEGNDRILSTVKYLLNQSVILTLKTLQSNLCKSCRQELKGKELLASLIQNPGVIDKDILKYIQTNSYILNDWCNKKGLPVDSNNDRNTIIKAMGYINDLMCEARAEIHLS